MAYQPIIAFPNRAAAATITGGSYDANFPAQNLALSDLSLVARTTNDAIGSTLFNVDLGHDWPIKVIALIGHGATLGAALRRIRGSTEATHAVPVVDTGWDLVWPVVYGDEVLEWEDDNYWTGTYLAEDVEGYIATMIYILDTSLNLRYWRIEIDDTANVDGVFQAAQLFMSGPWQPTYGMSLGASLGYNDPTTIEEALGGAEYFDERAGFRTVQFRIEHLGRNEALGRALEIQRKAGIHQDVFVIMDPDDTLNMLRQAFVGRLRSLSPIEYPYMDRNHTAWEIKEKVA